MKPMDHDNCPMGQSNESNDRSAPQLFDDIDSDIVETASALDDDDASGDYDTNNYGSSGKEDLLQGESSINPLNFHTSLDSVKQGEVELLKLQTGKDRFADKSQAVGQFRVRDSNRFDGRKFNSRSVVSARLISRAKRTNRRRLGVIADFDHDHDGDIDQNSERDEDDESSNTTLSDNHYGDLNNNDWKQKPAGRDGHREQIDVDNQPSAKEFNVDEPSLNSLPIANTIINRRKRDKYTNTKKHYSHQPLHHQQVRLRRVCCGDNQKQRHHNKDRSITAHSLEGAISKQKLALAPIDRDDKPSKRGKPSSGPYRQGRGERDITTRQGLANVSSSYSIFGRTFYAFKKCSPYHLFVVIIRSLVGLIPRDQKLLYNSHSIDSDIDESSSDSDRLDQARSNMPSKIKYIPITGDNRAKDTMSARSRELFVPTKIGRSKLDHHNYPELKTTHPTITSLTRFLLLLIIITICCAFLWLTHKDLFGDHNYLGLVETESKLGYYEKYSVSTDAKPCAKIGKALLAKGGSAVDAAIGTLLCMGVVLPNSLGLGGGCLMTLYDKKSNKTTIIDGREVAPSYAHENMFGDKPLLSSRGPLSVGVPGELAAYQEAWRRFGKLPWQDLFDETIRMAEEGEPMVEHLSFALRSPSHAKYMSGSLRQLFRNNQTGDYLKEGEILRQTALANTLKRIRDHGAKDFYEGLTGELFIKDLKEQQGNMTMEDLRNYTAAIREPLVIRLADDLILNTLPPPGSGIVLSVVLRIMKELGYYKSIRPQDGFSAASLYYHRLAEACKFAYAKRAGLEDKPDDPTRMDKLMSELLSDEFIRRAVDSIDEVTHQDDRYGGDEFFAEDHGTAHVSVLDADGNAAAVTTSVNLYFGSGLYSASTGIIYNDVMDDFVSPGMSNKFGLAPSKYNRIRPGRRPISSMAPSVLTDPSTGAVKLVIGGSGGAKITTAIASVCLRNIFLGDDIKTAVDSPRIHHQFLPNHIWYELNFPKNLLKSLEERGHVVKPILDRSSVIMAIAQVSAGNSSRIITANSDYRKGGSVDGM